MGGVGTAQKAYYHYDRNVTSSLGGIRPFENPKFDGPVIGGGGGSVDDGYTFVQQGHTWQ